MFTVLCNRIGYDLIACRPQFVNPAAEPEAAKSFKRLKRSDRLAGFQPRKNFLILSFAIHDYLFGKTE